MQSGLLLVVVVGKPPRVLELLAREDEFPGPEGCSPSRESFTSPSRSSRTLPSMEYSSFPCLRRVADLEMVASLDPSSPLVHAISHDQL